MRTRSKLICTLVPLLLLVSCSQNSSVRLRYEAEKLFYQAQMADQAASFRGDAVDPAVVRDVRDQFGKVVGFCLSALDTVTAQVDQHENLQLSGIAYQSASRLVQMYYANRRFDTLAIILEQLMSKATLGPAELATTYYNYGRSLQVAGKRDTSLRVFSNALEKFSPPVDDSGHVMLLIFNLPVRIHQAFVEGRDQARADEWFSRGETYYKKWAASSASPTELTMTSLGNLGRLYEDDGKWELAVQALSQMRDSTGQIAAVPYLHIGDIYAEQLGKYDEAVAIYDKLSTLLTGADTVALPAIFEKKATIQISKKNYSGARELLSSIRSRWPDYFNGSSKAQYSVARSFELEGNWDRAETEYRFLIDHYAGSEDALAAYLYLAKKAGDGGRAAEASQWYNKAEVAYKTLSSQKPGTRDDALALFFLAELHRQKQEWPEAASALGIVFTKFPLTVQGQRAAVMASEVLRDKLGNSRAADSLLMAAQNAAIEASGQKQE